MVQLNVTELRNGAIYREDGNLLQVLNYEHIKMGRGSGVVKIKVRNLQSGSITEKSFITGARVEEANVEKRGVQYLYKDGEAFYFMDPQSYEQFSIPSHVIGEAAGYLKDGMEVLLLASEGDALGVELPNSLVYTITETGPEEKGNTVSNFYKEAVLDNDLIVRVPMFMKVGDRVKVDTRTGAYVERVK